MNLRFFKIAAVYFVIAIILGIIMGIRHDFSLTSVHAHLNLLGWVSMALFGTIYHLYPAAGWQLPTSGCITLVFLLCRAESPWLCSQKTTASQF